MMLIHQVAYNHMHICMCRQRTSFCLWGLSIRCPFLVATTYKSCCCVCTLLYFPQQIWKFFNVRQVSELCLGVCKMWEVNVSDILVKGAGREKCSSVSTSPWVQWTQSLSSLGSQVCLWRPFSIAKLCSLILYRVRYFRSFGSLTLHRYSANLYSLLRVI